MNDILRYDLEAKAFLQDLADKGIPLRNAAIPREVLEFVESHGKDEIVSEFVDSLSTTLSQKSYEKFPWFLGLCLIQPSSFMEDAFSAHFESIGVEKSRIWLSMLTVMMWHVSGLNGAKLSKAGEAERANISQADQKMLGLLLAEAPDALHRYFSSENGTRANLNSLEAYVLSLLKEFEGLSKMLYPNNPEKHFSTEFFRYARDVHCESMPSLLSNIRGRYVLKEVTRKTETTEDCLEAISNIKQMISQWNSLSLLPLAPEDFAVTDKFFFGDTKLFQLMVEDDDSLLPLKEAIALNLLDGEPVISAGFTKTLIEITEDYVILDYLDAIPAGEKLKIPLKCEDAEHLESRFGEKYIATVFDVNCFDVEYKKKAISSDFEF